MVYPIKHELGSFFSLCMVNVPWAVLDVVTSSIYPPKRGPHGSVEASCPPRGVGVENERGPESLALGWQLNPKQQGTDVPHLPSPSHSLLSLPLSPFDHWSPLSLSICPVFRHCNEILLTVGHDANISILTVFLINSISHSLTHSSALSLSLSFSGIFPLPFSLFNSPKQSSHFPHLTWRYHVNVLVCFAACRCRTLTCCRPASLMDVCVCHILEVYLSG